MSSYNKMKAADLEHLLSLRDLPTDGTKLQKVARLKKQDHEHETEAKAIIERVKAVSTAVEADRALIRREESKNEGGGLRHGRVRSRIKTMKKEQVENGVGRTGDTVDHEFLASAHGEEDQNLESYMRSLVVGTSFDSTQTLNLKNASRGIIVEMTPESPPGKTALVQQAEERGSTADATMSYRKKPAQRCGWSLLLAGALVGMVAMVIFGVVSRDSDSGLACVARVAILYPMRTVTSLVSNTGATQSKSMIETVSEEARRLLGRAMEIGVPATLRETIPAWLY